MTKGPSDRSRRPEASTTESETVRDSTEWTAAACSGFLTVEVETQDGTPVTDTPVFVVDITAGRTVASGQTDSSGTFGPVSIPCGDYTAVVEAPGYRDFATQVTLSDGESEKIFVTLEARPEKVVGSFDRDSGVAVVGANGTTVGETRGVHGSVDSPVDDSTGVRGQATAFSGETFGVTGSTFSTAQDAAGVYGVARNSSGRTYGVRGETNSANTDAAGVAAFANGGNTDALLADAGTAGNGVRAITESAGRYAVWATNRASSGSASNAIRGVTRSPDAAAIVGGNTNSGGVGLESNGRLFVSDSIEATGGEDLDSYVATVANNVSNPSFANGLLVDITGVASDTDADTNFVAFRAGGTASGAIEGNDSGGVNYDSTGADYAEYLPRRDPEEAIEPGDVVGVVGGSITKDAADASRALVVTDQPAVTGNSPGQSPDDRAEYETVAFTGQVPVRVRGAVEDGDLVVPSGEGDGTARAVAAGEWTPGEPVVGQAWESDGTDGVSEVTVAVGIDDPAVAGTAIRACRERIATLEAERSERDARLDRLEEQNERLRERLRALESEVEATPSPADD